MRSSILLFLLLVQINHQVELGLCNQEMVYIKPSPNITCPGTPCHTLMQYVTNQISASNVSLLLLPGNHELTTEYYVADKNSILMMAYNPGMSSMVACNKSGRMSFRSLETIRISGIFFNGCGGNKAVSVKNFILEGSNFTNGSNDNDGGAWSIFQPNTLMIINCTFASNMVKGSFKGGGALHILGSERDNITVIWCTFSKNAVIDLSRQSSVAGGALHIGSVTDSSVTVVESLFIDNQVNSRAGRGGAIYAFHANLTISTCKFENNEAIGTSSGDGDRNTIASGGVLYASRTNLTIINGTFRNNQAKGTFTNGGALYISTTNLIFHGSLCTGNQANSTAAGYGGALYLIATNSTISKSVFSSNQANGSYSHGGALYNIFSPLVLGEKLSTVMNECIFTDNHANYSGGAVYIDGTQNPIITECNFNNNRLLRSFARGGAIYVTNSINLTTVNCSFNSNSVAKRLGKGGALYTRTTYTHLQGSRFSNNGADTDGGTVYVEIYNSYGTISAYQCSFYKNAGGVVYGINIRKVSIHLSNFTSNLNSTSAALHVSVASQNTTIIQELESAILINQSHFTENSRAAYSKGIKQIHIQNSIFTSNNGNNKIVEILGNGLPDNIVLISNSIFERNNGTIYSDNIALLSIDQSTFSGNAANHSSDGVIYVSGSHTNVSISHSLFQQNSAASCGIVSIHSLTDGDISMLSPRHGISLYSNTFKHNMATISGSVGCFRNASVTVSNNIFSRNIASYDGGVFLINSSTVTISESSFTNNSARYGGVARVFNSLVVLTESTFEQNTVSSSGGVFLAEMSNITIGNSVLNNNRAGNNGSIVAIYHSPLKLMTLGILQILSSNFSDNSALNGGIFYGENGAMDVDVQNSQLGFNNLTERGTFAAVVNLALSIAWKDSDGIQGGDIFACDSVVTEHNNSIIVTESTDCLSSTCKLYIFSDTNEESIDHLNRMALVATCTAGVADVTEAATSMSATVTESDKGTMIVALSSIFSTLTVLITLLVVIVVLVAMANKKLKSKSALGRDILQGKLSTPAISS